jgi:hypothetical protein
MNTKSTEIDVMRILEVLGLMVLLAPPQVASATLDYSHNTMSIKGQNFGKSPSFSWGSLTFVTGRATSEAIAADFPHGQASLSFAVGKYYLTLRFADQFPAIFAVDLGSATAESQEITVLQKIENLQTQLNALREQLRAAAST